MSFPLHICGVDGGNRVCFCREKSVYGLTPDRDSSPEVSLSPVIFSGSQHQPLAHPPVTMEGQTVTMDH